MSRTCQRCLKKMLPPKPGMYKYAMEWRFAKKSAELIVEMQRIETIKETAAITHITCTAPEVNGFSDRIRSMLKIPKDAEHPLLI